MSILSTSDLKARIKIGNSLFITGMTDDEYLIIESDDIIAQVFTTKDSTETFQDALKKYNARGMDFRGVYWINADDASNLRNIPMRFECATISFGPSIVKFNIEAKELNLFGIHAITDSRLVCDYLKIDSFRPLTINNSEIKARVVNSKVLTSELDPEIYVYDGKIRTHSPLSNDLITNIFPDGDYYVGDLSMSEKGIEDFVRTLI